MMTKRKIRRFLYISRADTPLRRLFDRASGFTMMVVLLGAAFFGTGWCIARFVNGATDVLTRVIDWCGYHPFVPSITIALMIAACVVIDCMCGEEEP
jgi:hypothetical protein